MDNILKNVVFGLLAIVLLVGMVFGIILGVAVLRNLNNPPAPVIVQQPAPATNPVDTTIAVENPVQSPASDCEARAKEIGAPSEIVSAICDAEPQGNGVSLRLPAGTIVEIGTITFDAENRVWFLRNFTVPMMASYAFEYKGSERSIFDAPAVVGSELGYGKNGEREPFTICFDTEGECTPPADLFPTN